MWDLTVSDVHTFAVGEGQWVVHNCNIGETIANGHAFDKHVVDQNEFPWIQTRGQFADHIEDVIHDPAAIKSLSGGRTSYFDNVSGTIVIHNPGAVDLGTAFIPTGSPLSYFNRGLR